MRNHSVGKVPSSLEHSKAGFRGNAVCFHVRDRQQRSNGACNVSRRDLVDLPEHPDQLA